MPTGRAPSYAAFEITVSLRQHIRHVGLPGVAVTANAGFVVNLPHCELLSPNTAYYEGPNSGMKFYVGTPRFAVEVRSENDYGVIAERNLEQKRHNYFAAGCLVVWDVDLLNMERIVRKYTQTSGATTPETTFSRGQSADAQPAVPGWFMPVNDLFESQTILLVEPTEKIRDLFKRTWQEKKPALQVIVADNATLAQHLLLGRTVDAVMIANDFLPNLNCQKLICWIRQQPAQAHLPIIALAMLPTTADDVLSITRPLHDAGADAVISKFHGGEALRTLERWGWQRPGKQEPGWALDHL